MNPWMLAAYVVGTVLMLGLGIWYALTAEEVHEKHGKKVSEYPVHVVARGTLLILAAAAVWPFLLLAALIGGLGWCVFWLIRKSFALMSR